MNITTNFINGRCLFNGFNHTNDSNPVTGKSGVNYYRYRFIGVIFTMLGLAYQIRCEKNGKNFKCYVYKKSFINWIERHIKDPTLIVDNNYKTKLINQKNPQLIFDRSNQLNNSKAEHYIRLISQNHQQNIAALANRNINPGVPLSYEEVLSKAKQEFASHPDKNEILKVITQELDGYSYKKNVIDNVPPYFYNGSEWYFQFTERRYPGMDGYEEYDKKCKTYDIARHFIASLPGVDVTPYTGSILK